MDGLLTDNATRMDDFGVPPGQCRKKWPLRRRTFTATRILRLLTLAEAFGASSADAKSNAGCAENPDVLLLKSQVFVGKSPFLLVESESRSGKSCFGLTLVAQRMTTVAGSRRDPAPQNPHVAPA